METNEAVPQEIEDEQSARDWTDYDEDGQLVTSDADEEWY